MEFVSNLDESHEISMASVELGRMGGSAPEYMNLSMSMKGCTSAGSKDAADKSDDKETSFICTASDQPL